MSNKYERLSELIMFFNQKFHMEQLLTYGFQFLYEKLELNSAAIYKKNGDYFELVSSLEYDNPIENIECTRVLNRLASMHGGLLTSNFNKYFEYEIISKTEMKIVIPLIVKSDLFGFIISNGIKTGPITEDDISFIEKATIIINNTFERAKINLDYKSMELKMNKDIFGLLFVNQSTRLLMKELNVENLYSMCVDMVRELTGSKITTIGIYDDALNIIIIKRYIDITSSEKKLQEFELVSGELEIDKLIYEVKKDERELKNIFKDLSGFENISAKYIILIVVRKVVIGFITISDTNNGQSYDSGTFELIESMVSAILISITNAKHFESMK